MRADMEKIDLENLFADHENPYELGREVAKLGIDPGDFIFEDADEWEAFMEGYLDQQIADKYSKHPT